MTQTHRGVDMTTSTKELIAKQIDTGLMDFRPPTWLDHPEPRSFTPKQKYRTIWISDIHLGTSGCNATLLLDFLASVECETLYLTGDIIDGWRLSKGWYWPDEHNEVVRRLLKMAHRGTRVVYIVGNHDEMLREYAGKL